MESIKIQIIFSILLILTGFGCTEEVPSIENNGQEENIFSPDDRNDQNWVKQDPVAINLEDAESMALNATMKFNLDYFKEICTFYPAENIVASPLSVTFILSMIANASDDIVKEDIYNILGSKDIKSLNLLARKLITELPNVDKSTTLTLANSLWYDKNYILSSGIENLYRNSYNAEIFPAGLLEKDPNALDAINGWVNDKTNTLIPTILIKIPDRLVSMLINAMYFKGSWQFPFEHNNTREGIFHGSKMDAMVEMMHKTEILDAYISDEFTAIKKRFGNGNYETIFIIPTITNDLNLISESEGMYKLFNKEYWQTYLVELSLPKFKCYNKNQLQLKDILVKLGLKSLLDYQGIMSNLFSVNTSTDVKVLQDAVISFDELGAEGAAVTFVTVETFNGEENQSIKQLKIDLNKPFIFFINETTTNAMLFAGKVENIE